MTALALEETLPGGQGPRPCAAMDLADEELAAGLMRGSQDCFAAAYRRWGALVQSLAVRSLGDSREAEDITQQVFMAAWHGRLGYRPERGPLPGWLVGITRRKIADALAARTRRVELAAATAARLRLTETGAAGRPESALDRVLIGTELGKLPQVQRRILRMAYYDGLPQTRIAELTGLPLGTVKGHVRRALRGIRRSLSGGPGEAEQ
ncbi:sigma-70 family RNA polymerase sigma factor [Streptomyces brevispora]|uniref:RNA polymerase sigma factor n=1 Tax=Streptomyces brevispora TaxID=887462 RepID=UPI002E3024DE|nr:sigma-70 family RNA polymerase sigma factor [Streptomyces brevispora]